MENCTEELKKLVNKYGYRSVLYAFTYLCEENPEKPCGKTTNAEITMKLYHALTKYDCG